MMIPAILVLLVAALVAADSAGTQQQDQALISTGLPYSDRGNIPLNLSTDVQRFLNKTAYGSDEKYWLPQFPPSPCSNDPATRSQRKSPLRMAREIQPNSKPQSTHGLEKLRWGSKRPTTPPPNGQGRRFRRNSQLRMIHEIRPEAVSGLVKPFWGFKWSTTTQPSTTSPQPATTSQQPTTTSPQPTDQWGRYHRNSPQRMTREIRHEAVNGMDKKMYWRYPKSTTTPRSSNSRMARGIHTNSMLEAAGSDPEHKDSSLRSLQRNDNGDVAEVKSSQNPPPAQRILGGRKAALKDFPSMLSLWVYKNNTLTYLCGATLLSEQWALTAAHCLMDSDPSKVIIRAGSYSKSKVSSDHPAEKFIMHEQFTLREGKNFFLKDDIAVIKVSERFSMNNITVKSARLPRIGTTVPPGTNATAVGWAEPGSSSSEIQAADLKIISKDVCVDLWVQQSAKLVKSSILCTQDSSKRFCGGSSGSPLFVKGEVVGIASAHLDVCVKTDLPGVHMDVAYFRDWIWKKTGV